MPRLDLDRATRIEPLYPTAAEIQVKRLLLAEELVHLVLEDSPALPTPLQQELRTLYRTLGTVRRKAREG